LNEVVRTVPIKIGKLASMLDQIAPKNLANCELLPAPCWALMAMDRCCSRNVPLNWQNFNINHHSSCVNDNAKDSL